MFKCVYVFEEQVDLLNLDEIVMEFVNRRRMSVCLFLSQGLASSECH